MFGGPRVSSFAPRLNLVSTAEDHLSSGVSWGAGASPDVRPRSATPTARGGVMHKFKIGQELFPARSVARNVPDGAYVVVKRLPERAGEFEYQIKNITQSDERVVRESQLRLSPWHQAGRPHKAGL